MGDAIAVDELAVVIGANGVPRAEDVALTEETADAGKTVVVEGVAGGLADGAVGGKAEHLDDALG